MTMGIGGGYYVLDENDKLHRERDQQVYGNLLYRALSACPNGLVGRADSKGRTVFGMHETAKRLRRTYIDGLFAEQARNDGAFSPGAGMHGPEDLAYKFTTILEEPRPPLNATGVWPINTEVPPGALTYRQSRMQGSGEAHAYRGGFGDDVTSVGISRGWFEAGVVYVISKATIDMMEQMRAGYTGINTQDRKMRHARYVIENLENKWTWNGNDDNDLWGLLNHPQIDTIKSGVLYKDSTSSNDIISDLSMWANYAETESNSTFISDTVLIAPKLHIYLSTRARGTGTDTSIWKWFMDANPHIKNVRRIRELNDVKGSGLHGMSFIRGGMGVADASASIVKPMGITILPPDIRALGTSMMLLSGFGGLYHREVGDSLNVFIDTN